MLYHFKKFFLDIDRLRYDRPCYVFPSIARIVATFLIFLFHYYAVEYTLILPIDFYAILIFCFLTGYLAPARIEEPVLWWIRKYFHIMLPFWLIYLIVIVANQVIQYKNHYWLDDILVFLGFGIFVTDRLYVISWYLTIVIVQYIFIAIISKFTSSLGRYFIMALFYIFFHIVFGMPYYAISFLIGFFIGQYSRKVVVCLWSNRYKQIICYLFFSIQSVCYYFFLIHGGVILFLKKIFGFHSLMLFNLSLLISISGALFLKKITNCIVVELEKKLFVLP